MTNVINLECYRLHEFVDGELRDEDAERFRAHLASCERCAADMPRLLELISIHEQPAPAPPVVEDVPRPIDAKPARVRTAPRPRSRRRALAAAAAIAIAAAVLVLVLPRDHTAPEVSPFASLPAHRTVEVRLAYADVAAYRPYQVSRGAVAVEDAPFAQMEALQRAGNWHGLAIVALQSGDRAAAGRYLERAARSGSVDTDRAALEILDGSDGALERALTLLDAVLKAEPDNTTARWNRALALVRLGLPLAAAHEFDRVSAAGEAGWATEAALRATELRAGVEPRRVAWEATVAAGKHWIAGDGPIVVPANAPLGLLRGQFYNAVRAAASRARVEALLPLAQHLDELYRGDVLTRYATTVAAADFRVRAPLALAFRDVVLATTTLDDKAIDKLLVRMHNAGANDLWMGLLTHTRSIARHVAAFHQAAQASGDPWLAVLAEHQVAGSEITNGNRLEGERLLFQAAEHAARDGLEFRRALIELELSELYLALRRYPEAEQRARTALVVAETTGEWDVEQLLIIQLAETSRFRYAMAHARAYLAEALERAPGACEVSRYVHHALANLAMLELDTVTARRESLSAPRCGEPLQLLTAMTWANLYRFGGTDADAKNLRAELAAFRAAGPLEAGQLAFADHVEGRLVIEHDPSDGRALLRKAIAEASGHTDDRNTKARAYSFSILALDAGKAGDYPAVLALLAEELGGLPAAQCTVGVAVEDERSIVVVRGPDGGTAGEYDAHRSSTHIDIASLMSATQLRRLEGCAEVSVLARPPVLGMARLLPSTIAWSYRLSGHPAPRSAPGGGPHLVVADTDPPAHLALPRLLPYAGDLPDALVLRGTAATRDRVLSAMRDASVIEFHTHGFVDRGLSDASYLALTPDQEGRYALTAADVQASDLRGAPLVILAACHAAASAPFLEESVGLPLAFVTAGARGVIASPAIVNDAEAGRFFAAVLARIRNGASAATAVRDERLHQAAAASSDWRHDVLVYQ